MGKLRYSARGGCDAGNQGYWVRAQREARRSMHCSRGQYAHVVTAGRLRLLGRVVEELNLQQQDVADRLYKPLYSINGTAAECVGNAIWG